MISLKSVGLYLIYWCVIPVAVMAIAWALVSTL